MKLASSIKPFLFIAVFLSTLYFLCQINLKNRQIDRLKIDLAMQKNENLLCNAFLEKQNKIVKYLELKTPFEPPDTDKIKKVFIKDKSCQGELRAYRELFDE